MSEEQITAPTFPAVTLADLPDSLQNAVQQAGWDKLMKVQSRALPYHFAGKDIMVQSRTGSGKTGAFLLPLLETLNPLTAACQALILVPTRELAQQVSQEATMLLEGSPMRSIAVYGGVKYGPQLQAFRDGVQIVIGTPGRVIDHLLQGNLSLDKLRVLIFDEADRMLSMGFFNDMLAVRRFLPKQRSHCAMYSATFPPNVLRLTRHFLHEPETLTLSTDHVHVPTTNHFYYKVESRSKDRDLVRLIEFENPDSAIIFCNTRVRVEYVGTVLKRFGYDAATLSSDLGQKAREKVIGDLRAGNLRLLIATDVAARGIDIPELSHVFQYEPPEDPELYIHRAGRTGRAGASGTAIALVDPLELIKLKKIGRQYKFEFEAQELPTEEQLATLVGERTIALLEGQLRGRDKLKIERMRRFMPMAQELSESEEGLALLAMLLDDYYQKAQHKPLAPPEEEKSSSRKNQQRGSSDGGRRRNSGNRNRNNRRN